MGELTVKSSVKEIIDRTLRLTCLRVRNGIAGILCSWNGDNVRRTCLISFAIILAVSMLISCGQQQNKKPPPPPMKVGTLKVDKGTIEQVLELSGTLNFVANTTVSSEVSAQVKSIEVADGQALEVDQVLLVFDDTKIKETANQASANLQKDEATLAYNKIEWEKNLELFKSGSISHTQYEQKLSNYQNALAQVEADKAVLAKALQDLNKTTVKAPVAGLLSNRYVERGDWVSEAGKLFMISDYTRVYLEAYLSDIDVGRLNVKRILTGGIEGEVTIDSYPGKAFFGKLTYIQPVANQGRLFQVRVYLDNPDMLLLQGMFARGRTVYKEIPDCTRVPLQALLEQIRDNDYNAVYVVDSDRKAQLRRTKIGLTDAKNAQVLEGLKDGDTVVVYGKEILSSGQPLEPSEIQKPAKASRGKETAVEAPKMQQESPKTPGNGNKRS
ncbi:RND family efflux transporter, MFP subunit [Desulfomonile tiedjei DSM 6799]|uniref:RND family efflux transporter, MFP subunit n=2 Tax=Desulfomonile tiedjei TaxID=2358 RepID=I4CAL7_DESTA|nr:RND family efflux transporter, MFP subunit [Desulfomonile tiedjei DSM 6799]